MLKIDFYLLVGIFSQFLGDHFFTHPVTQSVKYPANKVMEKNSQYRKERNVEKQETETRYLECCGELELESHLG